MSDTRDKPVSNPLKEANKQARYSIRFLIGCDCGVTTDRACRWATDNKPCKCPCHFKPKRVATGGEERSR